MKRVSAKAYLPVLRIQTSGHHLDENLFGAWLPAQVLSESRKRTHEYDYSYGISTFRVLPWKSGFPQITYSFIAVDMCLSNRQLERGAVLAREADTALARIMKRSSNARWQRLKTHVFHLRISCFYVSSIARFDCGKLSVKIVVCTVTASRCGTFISQIQQRGD